MPEAGLDPRLAKAMSHPLRQWLLMAYSRRAASPSELAAELGRPINEVAYHTKRLHEMGCIALVRTERGPGIKHFYAAVERVELLDDSWARLPASFRQTLVARLVGQVNEEARAAADAGVLDADDVHFSRDTLELDDAAWDELSDLLLELLARARELSSESADRRRSGGTLRPSILSVFHFPRV